MFHLCWVIYQIAWVEFHYPHATKRVKLSGMRLVPNPVMEWSLTWRRK